MLHQATSDSMVLQRCLLISTVVQDNLFPEVRRPWLTRGVVGGVSVHGGEQRYHSPG